MDTVYSYHTFTLPFTWRGTGTAKQNYERFLKCFTNNPNWEWQTRDNAYTFDEKEFFRDADEALLFYKEYQYFHPYVRSAIYGFDKEIVDNFNFIPAKDKKGEYHIYKGDKHYKLIINGVKLRIFNTGVALFVLEAENHGIDGDGNPQDTVEAVKNINDYGRRITLPYINKYSSISADKLEVKFTNIEPFVDDYKTFIENSVGSIEEIKQNVSLTHMCDFIKHILGYGTAGKYVFTSKAAKEDREFYVYPALDDRMHVSCIVSDKKAVREINANYEKDINAEKNLYELVFVDPHGNCTCQNHEMRQEYLKKAIYSRWIDYDSIYAITNQALIMLTTANYETAGYLLDSFLTQYVQMVQLCLVQRASIIKYKREAASIASRIQGYGRKISKRTIASIMDLQERYIAFQGQLCFEEVSPQEQGIEMYGMMKEALYIENENAKLKELIDSLYEAANTSLSVEVNVVAVAFTFISAVLAIAAILFDWAFTSDVVIRDTAETGFLLNIGANQLLWLVVVIMICFALWMWFKYSYRRK